MKITIEKAEVNVEERNVFLSLMTHRTNYLLLIMTVATPCLCSLLLLLVIVLESPELMRLWKRNAFILFEKPPSDQEYGLLPLLRNEVSQSYIDGDGCMSLKCHALATIAQTLCV